MTSPAELPAGIFSSDSDSDSDSLFAVVIKDCSIVVGKVMFTDDGKGFFSLFKNSAEKMFVAEFFSKKLEAARSMIKTDILIF